jgi:hypothetical protein
MSYEKIIKIIKKLDAKTSSKEVSWEKTSSDNEFQASFSHISVRLMRAANDLCYVNIYNLYGVSVEEVSDYELSDNGYEDEAGLLTALYEKAKRQALGVDEVLDELLDKLEDEIIF